MTYRNLWTKKAKWLTHALIISGTLNVGLLSTFIYSAFKENKTVLTNFNSREKGPKTKEKFGLQELLTQYSSCSFQELLLCLNDHDHVESGLARRDLALACLVEDHHFNLERALGGCILQKREISYGDGLKKLTVYPGLMEDQFQAILSYAKMEKWPLTAKGLYLEIQSGKPPYDPSLLEAFYFTSEYQFMNMLFSKTGVTLRKEHLAFLIVQSTWPMIEETTTYLQQNAAFTVDERRHFLLGLAEKRSRLAAKILLEIDQEYCLKEFDNKRMLYFCDLLEDKTPPGFLKKLLQEPRSDDIWKKAASILYEQAAETIPKSFELSAARRRFLELKAPERTTSSRVSKTNGIYTIKPGDSLWKIAQKYGTTVQAIREENHLKTDRLRPGDTLSIP